MTKQVRLATLGQVRRELAKVYSDARHGNLPTQDASRLSFVLQVVAKTLAAEDLETRVAALEAKTP